jgi:hypothetical protein
MAEQTAVEFLVSRINKVSYDKVAELIEEAKQMEKRQIRDAYNQGDTDVAMDKPGLRSGTMYYEQKYGKDK